MKRAITIVILLVALGAIAYGASLIAKKEAKPKVAADPCAVDLRTSVLNDVPLTWDEERVARTILTQYLEGLKQLTSCPLYGISEYSITSIGNLKKVQNDFMMDVKFDLKPLNLAENTLDTPETTIEGEWIRGKQATLGIIRGQGTSTTTASYMLAI